jgi:hypothetical protein
MRKFGIGLVALGFVAAFSGAVPKTAYAGDQQCYYGPTDPLNACTACARVCLGSGYKCCTIVSDP